jgi:hypothetical protein
VLISKEKAARHYWRTMREYNLLRRASLSFPDDIRDQLDELDVLSRYADWPLLCRLCLTTLASATPAAASMAEPGV